MTKLDWLFLILFADVVLVVLIGRFIVAGAGRFDAVYGRHKNDSDDAAEGGDL